MNFRTRWAYLYLILGCFWINSGCTTFGNVMTHPEVDVKTLHIVQVTPDSTRMVAVLKLKNPNPLFLHLNRVEYRLIVDRTTLISSSSESLPLIRNQHIQDIEIPIVIKNNVLDNTFPERGKHRFRFIGQATSLDDWAASPMLFETEGDVVFPQLLNLRFVDLNPINESGKFGFSLELINPNGFSLQLRRLQGQMDLDGHMYTWVIQPKTLKVESKHMLRVHIPCQFSGKDTSALETDMLNIKKKAPIKYWIQGEIESESPWGKVISVVNIKN